MLHSRPIPQGKRLILSEILIHIYLKYNMGTSTLESGLTSFFWKRLLNKRKKSSSTLSVRHYLLSGKPNYTHYTDEEALAQSYAFAWLQIQSKSVAKLEINPGIMVMSSSPTSAQLHVAGHGLDHVLPMSSRLQSW